MKYFLCVLGMVFVVEGLPYFTFPGRIKSVLEKVRQTPDSSLRVLGLILIIAGLVLVYFGTRD
jgi:uncharacterized protein YjeT (DUF2065 family)